MPGGRVIAAEYAAFQEVLPEILAREELDADEVTFGDYTAIVVAYLAS
jgi:hypothetical protein